MNLLLFFRCNGGFPDEARLAYPLPLGFLPLLVPEEDLRKFFFSGRMPLSVTHPTVSKY